MERSLNRVGRERGIRSVNLLAVAARFQNFQNLPHHDAGSLDRGLAVADFRVSNDVGSGVHTHAVYHAMSKNQAIIHRFPVKEYQKALDLKDPNQLKIVLEI